MDSSNSGSIQSSSSADNEDFTSPGESMSFLNFPPPPPQPPLLTSQQNHYSSSSFDLLSPYFTAFNSLPPDASPLQVDPTWPKSIAASDPSSSSPSMFPTCAAPLAGAVFAAASSSRVPAVDVGSNPSTVQTPGQSDLPAATGAPAPAATTRSSKKRSRASRRAPTTVLTTDTSNFRAMVQQFTGFPTPPFAPASSSVAGFSRPRFDFFHMGGGGGGDSTGPPPYLLRPFAQKVPSSSTFSPLSSSSSSLVEAIAYMSRATSAANPSLPLINSAAITGSHSASANTSSPFRDRQLPSVDLQNSNPLDLIQSSNLAFQSVIQSQTPLKYDLLSSPAPFKLDYLAGEGSQRNLITADVGGRAGSIAGMAKMPRSDATGEDSQATAAIDAERGQGSGSNSSTTATREINSRVSSWTYPPD